LVKEDLLQKLAFAVRIRAVFSLSNNQGQLFLTLHLSGIKPEAELPDFLNN